MSRSAVPEPQKTVAAITERLRHYAATREERNLPGAADPDAARAWLVRRTLEEMGVRCEDSPALQNLKGFLIASPRGTEIVLSAQLPDSQKLYLYAHLLAHAVLDHLDGAFAARFEYVEGREPAHMSARERREEMIADAIARAIIKGRLDLAPRFAYDPTARRRSPLAASSLPALGRQLLLAIIHHPSMLLYWRSPRYRYLRARPLVSRLAGYVNEVLGGEPVAVA